MRALIGAPSRANNTKLKAVEVARGEVEARIQKAQIEIEERNEKALFKAKQAQEKLEEKAAICDGA